MSEKVPSSIACAIDDSNVVESKAEKKPLNRKVEPPRPTGKERDRIQESRSAHESPRANSVRSSCRLRAERESAVVVACLPDSANTATS